MKFVEFLQVEWSVLSNAPFSFLGLSVLSFFGGFVVARYLASERLATKDAQLELAENKLNDFKSKLDVSSPDDAKRRFDELVTTVEDLKQNLLELSPRTLSEDRKKRLTVALKPFAGCGVSISRDGTYANGATLSSDLSASFKEAGWSTSHPMLFGPRQLPACGVLVSRNSELPNEAAYNALIKALFSAKIDFEEAEPRKFPHEKGAVAEITLTAPTS
ncbi:hypothetical protein shim_16230 [Shimia sp. SK013]|uniref:hypothetical protein n=1 Tax=Shimia sp. SK013 TaxID=1389006 RepID=UPI0006B502EB|nr:hypothetical protein [Shimia sp. SK013]KPA22176.1 hypothetical protein shim_16230 [Shimia sp. SK013]